MLHSRFARAFVLLVLLVAQGSFALPHRAAAAGAMAGAMAATGGSADDCQPATPGQGGTSAHDGMAGHPGMPAHTDMSADDGASVPRSASTHSCGCCQGSMPASHDGGCMILASCGPSSAAPSAVSQTLLPVDIAAEFAPAISAPAAHEFIPEPPPPRA